MATSTTTTNPANPNPRSLSDLEQLYGVDTDVQNIENKFKGSVNTAHNNAQDQFYQNMYGNQQTMMDTIKKNNAAAIASGASRGLQAAQNMGAMFTNMQETAAGATMLSQDRAAALSQAEQDALQYSDSLKQKFADVGSQMYIQDKASDSDYATQMGVANINKDMNDPTLMLDKVSELVAAGDVTSGKALLQLLGLDQNVANSLINKWQGIDEDGNATSSSATTPYKPSVSELMLNKSGDDFSAGSYTGDNFSLLLNGEKLRVQVGAKVSSEIANTLQLQKGEVAVLNGKLYINAGGAVRVVEQRKRSHAADWQKLSAYLEAQ